MSIIDDKSKGCRKWIKDPVHLNDIEDAYHAGTEDILNALANRIKSAEIVNVAGAGMDRRTNKGIRL